MSAEGPIVLFVCVHNAGRSQMAAGHLQHLAPGPGVGAGGHCSRRPSPALGLVVERLIHKGP
jgi:hypothetical protein